MGFPLISMHFQSNIVLDPGFVPFLEQKIQGLLQFSRTTFSAKKSLESMSFFSSSTSGEFYPEGLFVYSFSFAILLTLLSQH